MTRITLARYIFLSGENLVRYRSGLDPGYAPLVATDWIEGVTASWARLHPDLDHRAWAISYAISAIALEMAKREQAVFARHGVDRGEVGVLAALRASGPPHRLSPTALMKGLLLSSAGVTGRLDRLEGKGLIRRLPEPRDRRGVIAELTPKGARTVDEAVRAYSAEQEWFGTLTPAEARQLRLLLARLLNVVVSPGTASAASRPAAGPRRIGTRMAKKAVTGIT